MCIACSASSSASWALQRTEAAVLLLLPTS
jgi:hypothetical protein